MEFRDAKFDVDVGRCKFLHHCPFQQHRMGMQTELDGENLSFGVRNVLVRRVDFEGVRTLAVTSADSFMDMDNLEN